MILRCPTALLLCLSAGCIEKGHFHKTNRDTDAGMVTVEPALHDSGMDSGIHIDTGTRMHLDSGSDSSLETDFDSGLDGGVDAHVDSGFDSGRSIPMTSEPGSMDSGIDRSSPNVCGTWTGHNPIRTLFVGNSQITYYELHRTVQLLSESAPSNCPRIVSDSVAVGGANLKQLWEAPLFDGSRLQNRLTSGNYDAVVIAESIDLVDLRPTPYPADFFKYARLIISEARSHSVVPFLYATPYVEKKQSLPLHPGFVEMFDPQRMIGKELHVMIAAGGLAWLKTWSVEPTIDLYHSDREHPGFRGSYLSAATLYAAITGASPVGLTSDIAFPPYDPALRCTRADKTDCPVLTAAEAALFQREAWEEYVEMISVVEGTP